MGAALQKPRPDSGRQVEVGRASCREERRSLCDWSSDVCSSDLDDDGFVALDVATIDAATADEPHADRLEIRSCDRSRGAERSIGAWRHDLALDVNGRGAAEAPPGQRQAGRGRKSVV